ncbi:hypothetical protein [Streptomyces flavofungini]|uniref:hypothetical protein n=1 Tax=Streptomyces flavofungini TaxID=68200 RepID=UPI0025B0D0C7|nr:hypothetical protein [Streptomyces flavofungini]WJV44631.1 hypothetical protein QUY26_03255 [Streptomyces flavofungini]
MGVQDVHTALTALGAAFSGAAALAAVMVARWQTVFGRRVALESLRSQAAVERQLRLEAQRCEAWTVFLRASDAFTDVVWRLGEIDARSREEVLRSRSEALTEACSGLRVLGPECVVRHAEAVRERCARMERYAARRAVVRSALRALERRWCPGNAEWCEDEAHGCAFVAHDVLEKWADRDEGDRPDDLGFLEYLIRESGVLADDGAPVESGVLTEDDLRRLLAVAGNPVSWDHLVAEDRWLRPRTGYDEERGAFIASVRALSADGGESEAGRTRGQAAVLRGSSDDGVPGRGRGAGRRLHAGPPGRP